jgi:hypothetical protein
LSRPHASRDRGESHWSLWKCRAAASAMLRAKATLGAVSFGVKVLAKPEPSTHGGEAELIMTSGDLLGGRMRGNNYGLDLIELTVTSNPAILALTVAVLILLKSCHRRPSRCHLG